MVETIRNKWCDNLEEILRCSLCMGLPPADIYNCVEGHHFCQGCKNQLTTCPICEKHLSSSSRNRLAEDLCLKFINMKMSLIDPESEIRKLLTPDYASVACQTDESATEALKKIHAGPQGSYPCRIGSCMTNRYYEPLMKHIMTAHANEFLELEQEDNVFKHTWTFEYIEQGDFERAFRVPDMGTFFLKIHSDVFGNLTAYVLILHNAVVSRQFTYQLEICCCDQHPCMTYTGEMLSCRTPLTSSDLGGKTLQASRTEMLRMTSHEKRLKCTVLLCKKPPMGETKKRYKKKNHPKSPHNDVGTGEAASEIRSTSNSESSSHK